MKRVYQAFMMFVSMSLLCGIIYPGVVTAVAQLFFNYQSNGSLLMHDNKVVGSTLIAQGFTGQEYFWPRPSASNYEAVPSAASNLGPTSAELAHRIKEREKIFAEKVPADLLTASGSGLDPHISQASAMFQVKRIAHARGLKEEALMKLIDDLTEKPKFALWGEKRVNVLVLNSRLDRSRHE